MKQEIFHFFLCSYLYYFQKPIEGVRGLFVEILPHHATEYARSTLTVRLCFAFQFVFLQGNKHEQTLTQPLSALTTDPILFMMSKRKNLHVKFLMRFEARTSCQPTYRAFSILSYPYIYIYGYVLSRGKEHTKSLNNKEERSALWKHCKEKHNSVTMTRC